MQEWISVRELGRRLGRRHRAVQLAIETGRIPSQAVRCDPSTGRIVAVEFHAARLFWLARTDMAQALRTTEPLRVEPEPPPPAPDVPIHTSGKTARDALALCAAFECALLALPAALARVGLGHAIDEVVGDVLAAMRAELIGRGESPEASDVLRSMLDEERAHPGTWT